MFNNIDELINEDKIKQPIKQPKKAGRPSKQNKREIRQVVYFSQEEFEQLKYKADLENIPLSVYIRKSVLNN